MSIFVNDDGTLKTYAVVITSQKKVIAAFNWVGEAAKCKGNAQDSGDAEMLKGGTEDIELHNLTHPKCPDWLQELVRSDPAYCAGKAKKYDAFAAGLRAKAAKLVAEATEYEASAAEWRGRSEAVAAQRPPGM